MDYQKYIIDKNATIAEALAQLEQNGRKALFIAPDDRLEGAVSDGDIRRYLLHNADMNAPIWEAASKTPLSVTGYHEGAARKLLTEKEVSCVPMLDEEGRIHALVFANKTIHRDRQLIDIPVVMMAGGLGTRLYPYTEILPKPLIPVGGVTISEHILNRFKKFGCKDFVLVVNHKKNLIKSYFSEVDMGANVEFQDEDKPLGTGGGLAFFKGRFDGPVFVTNCDSVIEADYAKILKSHLANDNALTMVCAKKKITVPYGVVETDETGAMTGLAEKPSFEYLMNTGFYIVSPSFIDLVPEDTFTPITDVIDACRAAGKRVNVWAIEEECFVDIGQLEDLRAVEGKLR